MEQYGAMELLPVIMEITWILNTMEMLLTFALDESNTFQDLVFSFSSRTLFLIFSILLTHSIGRSEPSSHKRVVSASLYLSFMVRKYGVSVQNLKVLNAQMAITVFAMTVFS